MNATGQEQDLMSKDPAVEIAIATPLQAELVDVIRTAQPTAQVHYQPDLLPPARYPNDHAGNPDFRRSAAGQEQFTKINAELAKQWPVITEKKDAPADAKEWDGKPDKLKLLEK